MQNKLIEKAIIHLLGEDIGFEEAETYWKLLKKEEIEEDISRSKKYRIYEELFNAGLLLKIKRKNISEYFPIPPTFLYFGYELDTDFIKEQEKTYFQNYSYLFEEEKLFIESFGDKIDGLILFMISYFMRNEANILSGGPSIYEIIKNRLEEKFNKIKFIGIREYFKGFYSETNLKLKPKEMISDRRFCTIDDSFSISLFKTLDNLYIGYITSNKERINEKKDEFNAIWSF